MTKEIETAPTLQDGSGPLEPESVRSLRLEGWDRYEVLVPLGAGGGGQVYKARDPRLGRLCALKFLRVDDLDLCKRLLREAQAQARVEHEYVCKVYEVGSALGRPFIAMQFIDGQTLGRAATSMSREERVRLCAQVADAVHAAHRLGLIHRDIKPSNVMVERGTDGGWRPYVMDFGLARETAAPGVTQTGAVMGTPQYMAPEQARGGKEIDRRADVYGLGATLYEVLGGRPPFDGNTLVDVLMKVVYEEPEPLRKLAPQVPVDLDTIVMKCLEKDPARRYDTARGLGEDLRRFLDGEPVSARRAGAAYKLAKKVRKHRALVAVGAAALLAAGGLGLVSYQQRRDAAGRAQLAQQLGQEVAQMESGLRYAHLAPLHDTRLERERMRARMKDLELRMAKLGPIAEGPVRYALGRGHLALREWDAARLDLDAAFAAGQRTPEVRYALGQTLGALYQTALAEAERDAATREAKRKELERTLRDPALEHLRAAKAAEMESPEYAEGLIALYERRWDDALAKAHEALAKNPLLYEAERLAGDVHQAAGREKQRRGDWNGARAAYADAQAAYDRAAQIGRSDPSIYEGSCVTWVQDLQVVGSLHGDVDATERAAVAACDRALTADPELANAYDRKAVAYERVAEHLLGANQDPRESLRRAIATAEQLTRVQPESYLGYLEGGNGWELLSEWQDAHGEDPLPAMDKAIALLRKSVELAAWHSRTWDDLGMTVWKKAAFVGARGGDAAPVYEEAIRDEREAVRRDASNALVHNNLANALSDRAFWAQDHGQDPTPWNDEAIAEYRRSIEINPNWASAYSNMGTSLDLRGRVALAAAKDPRADWDAAFGAYKRSGEIQPKFANAWGNGADVLTQKGAWEVEHKQDAGESITVANAWLARAQALRPGNYGDSIREAELGMLEARHGSRERGFARAEAAIARARKENPNTEDAFIALAEVERWRAELGGKADVRRGLAALAEAEKRNPGMAEAALLRGHLLAAAGEKAQAVAALQEARRRKPALAHEVDEAIKKLE